MKVKIAGQEYEFSYKFSSFVAMQKKHGINVFDTSVFTDPSPITLTILVWGGVIFSAPELTPDKIGETMTVEEASANNAVVVEALIASLPKPKKAPEVDVSAHS